MRHGQNPSRYAGGSIEAVTFRGGGGRALLHVWFLNTRFMLWFDWGGGRGTIRNVTKAEGRTLSRRKSRAAVCVA
jgi:hypothetical protein